MVTRDVDFVVASGDVARPVEALSAAGFRAEQHRLSVNFTGGSQVSIQLSTEEVYLSFPDRSVPTSDSILLATALCCRRCGTPSEFNHLHILTPRPPLRSDLGYDESGPLARRSRYGVLGLRP